VTAEENETREVVGVFIDVAVLEAAIDELLSAGFAPDRINLLVDQRALDGSVDLRGLESKLRRPATEADATVEEFVHPETEGDAPQSLLGGMLFVAAVTTGTAVVATAGLLGGALAAATAGTLSTGAIGTLLARIIHKSDAEYFAEQLERGRWLLFVRADDKGREDEASRVLARHASFDVRKVGVPLHGT
jgi:hypothetical protein